MHGKESPGSRTGETEPEVKDDVGIFWATSYVCVCVCV